MSTYWGQPANRDELGTLTRWKVRKWHSKHDPVTLINVWNVFMPDGTWSGSFDTFAEALSWATNPFERMGYWLEQQR